MPTNRERLIKLLSIDEKYIKNCDIRNCIHCGEGCLLGYSWETFQDGRGDAYADSLESIITQFENLQHLYSKDFQDQWRSLLHSDRKRSREFLPCAHTAQSGCTPSHCTYLGVRETYDFSHIPKTGDFGFDVFLPSKLVEKDDSI